METQTLFPGTVPHAGHDTWMIFLDLLSGSSDVVALKKSCSLVCRGWHAYLQPRLFSSVVVDLEAAFHKQQDMCALETLLPLSHLVRRLCLKNWPESLPYLPRITIQLPALFPQITQFELRSVCFKTYQDLRDCMFSPKALIETLLLIDCIFDDLMDQFDGLHSPVSFTHGIALRSQEVRTLCHLHLEYSNEGDVLFSPIMTRSLALSPVLRTLRKLRATATCAEYGPLLDIFVLLGNASCQIEQLELVILYPMKGLPTISGKHMQFVA
jgi:hypothetical protein